MLPHLQPLGIGPEAQWGLGSQGGPGTPSCEGLTYLLDLFHSQPRLFTVPLPCHRGALHPHGVGIISGLE